LDETVSHVDLAATFTSVIGHSLDSKEAIDSHDLVPLL
jgi:hypothetical protein